MEISFKPYSQLILFLGVMNVALRRKILKIENEIIEH